MNLTDVYQETGRVIAMARNDGYTFSEIFSKITQAMEDSKKEDGRFRGGLTEIFEEAYQK